MATTTKIGELELDEAAREAAGNWKRFDCFVWWRESEIEDPENWTIFYSHHRDSGLLEQSNAEQIQESLAEFIDGDDPDVVVESHNHWAVGHVDGFSIRVFRDGEITDAFRTLHGLLTQLEDYPILDEDDYSEREYDATIANIVNASYRIKSDYELPEHWEYDVYGWLSENEPSEIENTSDQGGYPSEAAIKRAFQRLDFECLVDDDEDE